MAYMGTLPKKPDGTEGYASITLTLKKPDSEIKTIACIIKNDDTLQKLQKDYGYVTTHKKTKFFLYFYCSESDLSNRLVKSRIIAHRFTKPLKDKDCIIKNKEGTELFIMDNHVFLPACHKDFKTPDFTGFLETYSKAVSLSGNLSVGKCRGVQNSNAPFECLRFSLSSSNSALNITEPADTVFQNLVDGPLLFKEASKRWRLIGWYKKAPEGDRITVYHLRTQDTTDICQSGLTGPPTSTDQANQSGLTGPPTSTDQVNQSGLTGPPTSTDQANQSGLTGSPTSTDQANQSVLTGPPTSTDQANQSGLTGPPTSTDQANQSGLTGPPTSTDQANQSGLTGPPTSTDQANQSGLTGPPTSTDQANQSVSAIQPTCTDQSHQSGPPIATSPNPPGSTGLPTSTNSQPNPPESTGPSTSTDAQPNPPGSTGLPTSTNAQQNPPGSTGLPTSTNSQETTDTDSSATSTRLCCC